MGKEGGSFSGKGMSATFAPSRAAGVEGRATMTLSRHNSPSQSFGAERTGALSYRIGKNTTTARSGLSFGEFHPKASLPSAERRVTGYRHDQTAAFQPSKEGTVKYAEDARLQGHRQEKPNKYRVFDTYPSPRKPLTEKAGIGSYKSTTDAHGEKMTYAHKDTKTATPQQEKRLVFAGQKIATPRQEGASKEAFHMTMKDRSLTAFGKQKRPERQPLTFANQTIKRPEVTHVGAERTATAKKHTDHALTERVAQAFVNVGIVKTLAEGRARAAETQTEQTQKPMLQLKKELHASSDKNNATNEAKKTALVQQIRLLAQNAPDMNVQQLQARFMDNRPANGSSESNASVATSARADQEHQQPEKKKKQQLKRRNEINAPLRKQKKEGILKAIFDKVAASARKDLVRSAALRVFIKKQFAEEHAPIVTGRDVVAHLPKSAPKDAISGIAHSGVYDGSYEELHRRMEAIPEIPSVNDAVQAADTINYIAPPVDVGEQEDPTRKIYGKDIVRVFHGTSDNEEEQQH